MRTKKTYEKEYRKKLSAIKGRKAGGIFSIAAVILISFIILYINNGGFNFENDFSVSLLRPGDNPIASAKDEICTVHVIDIGQGDSTLICVGSDHFVLIDTGPDSAEENLRADLDELGIKSLDYLVLSHPHEDHIGGADMVLKNYDVENVLMPDVTSSTMTFSSLLDAIEGSNASVEVVSAGYTFSAGTLNMTVLSPIRSSYDSGNEWSIVLKAVFGNISMLFTGDAEEINEHELLNKYGKEMLRSDYLKVGHHGSSTSSCDEFIDAVSPTIATISCGAGNTYGHPDAKTLDTLEKYSVQVYRTDDLGNIVLTCDGETIKFK